MPEAGWAAFFKALWAKAWVRFVVQVAVSYVIAKATARNALKNVFAGTQTTSRGALEFRKFGYGEALVGGAIIYNNTHGSENEWLDYQIAYVDHFADLVEFRIDDTFITAAQINWTPPTADATAGTGDGEVSQVKFKPSAVSGLHISWYPGFGNQPANTLLTDNYGTLGTADKARGVFNAVFQCLYDKDTQTIWRNGPPQSMLALLKLRRIYDRRRYALNADPTFNTANLDFSTTRLKWFGNITQTVTAIPPFSEAANVLSITDNDASYENVWSERIPVDTSKLYTVQFEAQEPVGDRVNLPGVAFFDSAGDNIVGATDTATGWLTKGTYFYFGVNQAVFGSSWTTYSITFGVGGTAEFPQDTTAVEMAIGALVCGSGTISTDIDIRNFVVFEGTAQHDITDETTWEWSDNPACCIADYLTQYMNVDPADEIDWEANIVAAQACDVLVAIPTASTEKRFTCNGAWLSEAKHETMLVDLKTSMAGNLVYTGGQWVMTAGVWSAPVLTFDENALAGDVTVQGSSNRDERYNVVKGFFTDPARQHVPVEFYSVTNAAYVTRDNGRELDYQADLAFVNSEYQCQRVAIRILEQFDNQIIATIIMNEQGAKCYPGLIVSWTLDEFSWTAKAFRCIEWRPLEDGTFEVTFREDFASRYTDPAEGGYTSRTAAGDLVPGAAVIPPPSALSTAGHEGSIALAWTNPPPALFDYIEIWQSSTNDRSTAIKLADVKGDTWIDFVGDTTTRYYWVRGRRDPALYSTWHPVSDVAGVSGTASSAGLVEWYYIKPTDGTSIQNGAGTLTIEARHVLSGVDSLLAAGTIKLYEGSTEITVANGYAAGSDGYTGVFDSGDISGSVVVELKDGPAGTPFDTITLVDITDGLDAVYGYIEPTNGLAWTRAVNQGAWTPATLTSDLECTFVKSGAAVARINRRITLTESNGQLAATVQAHSGGDLNTGRVTVTVTGSASNAISVEYSYTFGGQTTVVSETISSAQGGSDGDNGFSNYLTNSAHVVAADSDGTNYSLTEAGGTHKLFEGTTDRTLTAVHIVSAGQGSLVVSQDETNYDNSPTTEGTFVGGSSYAALDTITLSDGTVITVDAVSGGVVTEFSVPATTGTTYFTIGGTLTQSSSSGSGTGFTLTPDTDNINAVKVQNGLTMLITPAGVYSLSGGSWTTNLEVFTMRATYGGVDYDQTYTIVKALGGTTPAEPVTGVGAIAVDIAVDPDDGEAALKVDSDGDVYKRQGLGSSYGASEGTWMNSGAAGDYDVMFEGTGDTPTGAAVNTWLDAGTDRDWLLIETTNGQTKKFTGDLKWRDGTTFELLATASATVQAQVTS